MEHAHDQGPFKVECFSGGGTKSFTANTDTIVMAYGHSALIAETVETLHNAVLELTPAAVKSGWFQETAMVFAIHKLQCDVDNILVQLVFVVTHPKEEFAKSGHATMCFTKGQFNTIFVSDRVKKLRDLQELVFDTPLFEVGPLTGACLTKTIV
jgi:hypothetical protein